MQKRNHFIAALLALFIFAGLSAQNSWEKKTSFAGSKRARAVAFTIGTRGYLATGEDTADVVTNDLWEYDPGSDCWTQKASLPGTGRRDAVGFAIGNKGYVGTGINAAESALGTELNDFYEYSPATNTWTARAAYPGGFGGIYFATGFAVNGKGYVCCGKQSASFYSQELWEFNPATNNWTQKANYPAGTRYGQSSFVLNNKAYVGLGTEENWFVSEFYEYNPASNTWTQKAAFPGSARGFASAFTIGSKGYMGMGLDGGYRDDWYEYDAPTDSWSVKAPFGGEGRRSAPSFVIYGAAYVMTGKGNAGKHRDCWQYMPYVTGTEEQELSQASVYPNPASDYLIFDINPDFFAGHENLSIRLYTSDGRLLCQKSCAGNPHIVLQNEGWATGTYFYTLADEKTNYGGGRVQILN